MKSKLLKLTIRLLFVTVFLCSLQIFPHAQTKTVRVGFFDFENYFDVTSEGEQTGYGYDFLNELAKYTDWEFEYVYATWDECVSLLESGEIDLVDLADKTPEREERFDFSEMEVGYTQARLLTLMEEPYTFEGFDEFNGMRVGLLHGNAKNEAFEEYKKEHNFVTTDVIYMTYDEVYEALYSHEVDAIVMSNIYESNQLKVIANFDTAPYYYMLTKGNTELLNELNTAMNQAINYNPQLREQLYQKYYSLEGTSQIAFTKEEHNYIEQTDKVIVSLASSRSVLSNYTNGEYGGISYSLMELISEKSGIDFEYVTLPKGVRAIDYLNENEAEIVIPIMKSAMTTISNELELLSTDLPSELVVVTRMGEDVKALDKIRIVLPKGFINAKNHILTMYPNAEITYLESNKECFKAIASNKADLTFENKYVAYNNMRSPQFENLEIMVSNSMDEIMSLAMKKNSDPILTSILRKTIASISNEEYNDIIQKNTVAFSYKMTLLDYVYRFKYSIISAIILFVSLIVFVIYSQVNYKALKNTNKKLIETMEQKKTATNEVAKLEAQREADKRYQEELRKMSEIDTLTGILNKQGFYNQARDILVHNPDKQYIIVQWDLNRFKIFNDKYGIKAGDTLLIEIAKRLQEEKSKHALCARLQADHFVELYEVNKFNIVKQMNRMEKWFDAYPADFELTFCVGVYIIEDPSVDIGIMCDRALLALYKTKNKYGNNYAFYDDELRDRMIAEQEIVGDMVSALENDEFEVYFQPQYDYANKQLVGAEALVRWNHPEKGMIFPGAFIPVFEKNGFIVMLDRYVWEKVCQYLHKWKRLFGNRTHISISVNISRYDIYNSDLCKILNGLIMKYDLSPSELKLEITESAYVENPDQLIETVQQLREYGFTIEMDDFGSGYSSLNTLKDVPVDILKLDMRFLNSTNSNRGGNILNSVMRMAKWLDLKVIAEGVETKENADFLASIGCDYMQGYYFAKPMKLADFEELMRHGTSLSMQETTLERNEELLEEVWRADSKFATIFNKMAGAAALIECQEDSIEIIRYNERFMKIMHARIDEQAINQHNLYERMNDVDREIFKRALETAYETKSEAHCEVHLKENLNKKIADMWLSVSAFYIADNGDRKLFYMRLEETTEVHILRNEINKSKHE